MPAPRTGGRALASRNYRGSTKVDVTGTLQHFQRLEKYLSSPMFADAMQEVADIGVKSMQDSIINPKPGRDAPFSSLARQLGVNKGQGRYRTGKMYNSVGSRLQNGPKVSQIVVGYIKGKFEDYFKFQDRGFWNKWELIAVGEGYRGRPSSGPNAPRGLHFGWRKKAIWTEGTFALRDAKQDMLDAMPKVIKKYEKKIAKMASKVK